jgi:hypothetical protein
LIIIAIQKPYDISIRGRTIPSEEDNLVKWKVSGATSVKFSIYIYYNNFKDIKITNHGLSNGDLIINTTRDSSMSGIRSVITLNTDNFYLNADITNQAVGDSIDKFNKDVNLSATAGSTSTSTVIYVPNTGSVAINDIVHVDGEYRFVSAVDPNVSITVSQGFSASTADKAVTGWNKLGTNAIEYAWKIENVSSYATEYKLLGSSILYGRGFKIKITVFDENNNSATSDPEVFEASARPTVAIDPIGTNGTVQNQSYNFTATYSQVNSVAMKSYIAHIYNDGKTKISSSDIKTSSPLEYLFDGLQSDKVYYVEFQGTSEKGLTGTSGLIQFDVVYAQPNMSTNLTAENYDDASIRLTWAVIQILGDSFNTTYIGSEKIDATDGKVWFNQGININDFTFKIWLESVTDVTVSDGVEVIKSKTPPANKNAIWLKDSSKSTEQVVGAVASRISPVSTDVLWIRDYTSNTEKSYDITIDRSKPVSNKTVWINGTDIKDILYLAKLEGDNGYITLEYYNSGFHLYKFENGTKTLMKSYQASGSSYYVYIQQEGDIYNLYAEVMV